MQKNIFKIFFSTLLILSYIKVPAQNEVKDTTLHLFTQKGYASYYARKFEKRKTANGERYKRKELTAAHKTLPFNTKVKVTNPKNGRWVIVRINDRGPFHKKRIIDVSERAARHLGIFGHGHSLVIIHEVPDSAQIWSNQSQHY